MKAIVCAQHGLPIDDAQSLHERNVPEPEPGRRDLRVRVRAIAVNPVDKPCSLSAAEAPALPLTSMTAWEMTFTRSLLETTWPWPRPTTAAR